MPEMSRAKRKALKKFEKRMRRFGRQWRCALRSWKLEAEEEAFLRLLTTAPRVVGRSPWSNQAVRRAAAEALIDVLLRDFAQNRSRKRWLATFCFDAGMTWERQPVVDTVALASAVWKGLDEFQLDGIAVIEVDVLKQRSHEPGRRLLFHIHAVVSARPGAKFPPKKAAAKLKKSRRFRNELGAPSVRFDRIRATAADIAWVAGYLCKLPCRGKNMVPRRKQPGKYRFWDCTMAPASALRLVEIMSQLEATNMIFGIGKRGKRLRRQWRKRFKRLLKTRRGPRANLAKDHDIKGPWAHMRATNGSKRLKPCQIITRARDRS